MLCQHLFQTECDDAQSMKHQKYVPAQILIVWAAFLSCCTKVKNAWLSDTFESRISSVSDNSLVLMGRVGYGGPICSLLVLYTLSWYSDPGLRLVMVMIWVSAGRECQSHKYSHDPLHMLSQTPGHAHTFTPSIRPALGGWMYSCA